MASLRCKMLVKAELEKIGRHYALIELGNVDIIEDIKAEQRLQLKAALLKSGLELMDDKKAMLIEKIKNVIIEMVHYAEDILFKEKLSVCCARM